MISNVLHHAEQMADCSIETNYGTWHFIVWLMSASLANGYIQWRQTCSTGLQSWCRHALTRTQEARLVKERSWIGSILIFW